LKDLIHTKAITQAGEKRKEEEMMTAAGPVVNVELKALRDELQVLHASARLDGFGLYLYGIVLRELKMV
jgi:hypothetical protein